MSADAFRQTTHRNPWRSAFEIQASIIWFISSALMLLFWAFSGLPRAPLFFAFVVSVCFGLFRLKDAAEVWNLRINLLGKGMMFVPLADFLDHCDRHPNDLWLGKGFQWEKHHSQRLMDLLRAEQTHVTPPPFYAKLRGVVFDQQNPRDPGLPWIHGVGGEEEDIHLGFHLLEGNTLILGTTGAGKTTLLRLIAAACIRRGDCLIVIDPKGDVQLAQTMSDTCKLTKGRENDYLYFHPAHPSNSVRYDVMYNFDRITSLASRIANQIPSKTGTDQFVAFNWRVLLVNCQMLIECGERPTIARIRRGVEGGLDLLLERTLVQYFERVRPGEWRAEAERFVEDAAKEGKLPRPTKTSENRFVGYCAYYKAKIEPTAPNDAIRDGLGLAFHDRQHYVKMTAALTPVLGMLDSGDMSGLLSPVYDDVNDMRRIVNTDAVITGRRVMYIGLDALSDSVVSSAIGSIILSDMAACAGAIYNYSDGSKPTRISFIVDEASEVANMPLQQLASKGRGAGVTIYAASQTVPDWIARLSSNEKAMSTLGNFNNLIALRLQDESTCEFVTRRFGESFIDSRSYALNTSTQSSTSIAGYTGGEGVNVSDQLMDTIPPDLMNKLPNHQYFAQLAGGRLWKGRQQVLV